MSELKAYIAPTPDGTSLADYYLKSEADKEIEFWKNQSHEHYEHWFSLNKQYEGWFGKVVRCERAERELRHQKFKRCLAMAKICEDEAEINHNSAYEASEYLPSYEDGFRRKAKHYERWHKRWLELAEIFKEAK